MDHFAPFVRSFVVVRLQPIDLSRDKQGAELATSTFRPLACSCARIQHWRAQIYKISSSLGKSSHQQLADDTQPVPDRAEMLDYQSDARVKI